MSAVAVASIAPWGGRCLSRRTFAPEGATLEQVQQVAAAIKRHAKRSDVLAIWRRTEARADAE